MTTRNTDLDRLYLFIQRLMDADLVLEEEAAPLLNRVEAAMRSPRAAHPDAIQSLIEAVALLLERWAGPQSTDVRAVVKSLDPLLSTQSIPSPLDGDPPIKRATSPQRRTK